MFGAGERSVLVAFERLTRVADAYGQGAETWSEIGKAWAAVRYGTGAERREAAATQAQQTATITMLANSQTRALTTINRASFAGAAWDIQGVAPSPNRAEIALTVTRGQD